MSEHLPAVAGQRRLPARVHRTPTGLSRRGERQVGLFIEQANVEAFTSTVNTALVAKKSQDKLDAMHRVVEHAKTTAVMAAQHDLLRAELAPSALGELAAISRFETLAVHQILQRTVEDLEAL